MLLRTLLTTTLLAAFTALSCGDGELSEAEIEEFELSCEQAASKDNCDAIANIETPTHIYSCGWAMWQPAQLDGDVCSFGEATGTCVASDYDLEGDGCDGHQEYRTVGDTVELALFDTCYPTNTCRFDADLNVVYEGPAECICAGSPDFPRNQLQ